LDFFNALLEGGLEDATSDIFFRKSGLKSPKLFARCIAVDMEAKVVSSIISKCNQGEWSYAKDRVCCQKRGAGNNWANGFMSCLSACESVMELVEKEVLF
jgi:hypothetical protein